MSEQPKSLKRFALLAVGLVALLLGVSNIGELTGQATGSGDEVEMGGCGGEYDATLTDAELHGEEALFGWGEPKDCEDQADCCCIGKDVSNQEESDAQLITRDAKCIKFKT